MIVCPAAVAGEVVGTLNLGRMGGDEAHFSRDEFELVQLFAAQASIALRNAEAHGEVLTRAEHDALTGLRNHGAFQRALGALDRRDAPFALLMLDLDAFKDYNDTHGHPAGDALLVADRARHDARPCATHDRVYRYGGDEFAILLPEVDGHGAREVAERIRAAVARVTLRFGPPVTVSVGHRAPPGRCGGQGRPGGSGRPGAIPRQARRPDPPAGRRPHARPVPGRARRDDAQAAGAPGPP